MFQQNVDGFHLLSARFEVCHVLNGSQDEDSENNFQSLILNEFSPTFVSLIRPHYRQEVLSYMESETFFDSRPLVHLRHEFFVDPTV